MGHNVDNLLKRIRSLSSRIDEMNGQDPNRSALVAERESLRSEARTLADAARHPRSVETEISMLEDRLAEIERLFITKGHAEKHLTKGFSDPGAYSATINRKIDADHAEEIDNISSRLDELRLIGPSDET